MNRDYDELMLIMSLVIKDNKVKTGRLRIEDKLAFKAAYHVLANRLDPHKALSILKSSGLLGDSLDVLLFEESYWRYVELLNGRL